MKYYIGKYWAMANSADAATREKGSKKWLSSTKKYGPYFEIIKDKLPKKFIQEFNKNHWFHDFVFDDISIINAGWQKQNIQLSISNDDNAYKILLAKVIGFAINVPTTKYRSSGNMSWGYSEFELLDDNTWVLRILCDIFCEMEFNFNKISITKITKLMP